MAREISTFDLIGYRREISWMLSHVLHTLEGDPRTDRDGRLAIREAAAQLREVDALVEDLLGVDRTVTARWGKRTKAFPQD